MDQQKPNIIYEDSQIIVCEKPAGLPTQSRSVQAKDMVSLLKNHLSTEENRHDPYLAVIHRLDQPVRGLLVFAKTPAAAKNLNRQLADHTFGKYYLALVDGPLPREEGALEDYMVKDAKTNTSRVCSADTPGAKLARLQYREVKRGQGAENWGQGLLNWGRRKTKNTPSPTLVSVRLETGRHHQIRVQLANIGCPIVGDARYNKDFEEGQTICLCAYKLEFRHPKTGEQMSFQLDNL